MHAARLLAVEPLNTSVQRLLLGAESFDFAAGQYLQLHAAERRVPMSIASAPSRLPELELHYRSTPGDPDAAALDVCLTTSQTLEFDGPCGNVTVTTATEDALTLIAGGTGVSQAASIIEHLLECPQSQPVHLTWSLALAADGYRVPALQRAAPMSWFTSSVVHDDPDTAHNAAVTWINTALTPRGRFLLCGAPGFVYACADALLSVGVARATIDSDAFDYAPRSDWERPSVGKP